MIKTITVSSDYVHDNKPKRLPDKTRIVNFNLLSYVLHI